MGALGTAVGSGARTRRKRGIAAHSQAGEKPGVTLIVGHDPALRDGLEELFKISGLRATAVSGGEKAISYLQAHLREVQVALLDAHMAGMNAVATFNALREIKPSLYIILCSSAEPHEVAARFDHKLDTTYLRIPFDVDHLLQHIRELLH